MGYKHTPEPWVFNQEEMKINGSGDYEGRTIIANVSPKMDFSRGMGTQCANAARIVECVNALAEIDDPKKWVEDGKDSHRKYLLVRSNNKAKEIIIEQLQSENSQYKTAIAEQAISHSKQVEKLEAENERLKEKLEIISRGTSEQFTYDLAKEALKGE